LSLATEEILFIFYLDILPHYSLIAELRGSPPLFRWRDAEKRRNLRLISA